MPRLTYMIGAAVAAIALTAAATVPAVAAQRPAAHQSTKPMYYLSLGDSLSVGVQPNAKGVSLPTREGYSDQLYALLKKTDPTLLLERLGCPGETSLTLNVGGICGYKGDVRFSITGKTGRQLTAAISFLRLHPGQVPLITLDIGANDLNACIALGVISKIVTCLTPVFPAIAKNLAYTLTKLRKWDPKALIVGMTYYDPELADWLTGASGQQFAQASILLATQFSQLLAGTYQAAKSPVADVFSAFDTTDMTDMVTVPGLGKLPKDVALICKWTYECVPPPVGPNEHNNQAGYAVLANTFLATLNKVHFKL
jgi:lysophospholipase L1-like esterase